MRKYWTKGPKPPNHWWHYPYIRLHFLFYREQEIPNYLFIMNRLSIYSKKIGTGNLDSQVKEEFKTIFKHPCLLLLVWFLVIVIFYHDLVEYNQIKMFVVEIITPLLETIKQLKIYSFIFYFIFLKILSNSYCICHLYYSQIYIYIFNFFFLFFPFIVKIYHSWNNS